MTTTIEAGTLHHVAPGALLLERNIRDCQPTKELIDSVRDLGVLEPITAVSNPDGGLVVRFGHRRTLAAVEAGLDTVPVYVSGSDWTDDDAEVDRIIRQRDENTHRMGLTAAEEVGVVEQLVAFGLTASQISAKARIPRPIVDTAAVIASSELARKAATKYEALTLDQAATVAEFESEPETAKALVVAAIDTPDSFAHIAQRARDERIRTQHRDRLLAALEADGVAVVAQPQYGEKVKALHQLRDEKNKVVTEDTHTKCAGHVAWLGVEWVWVDAEGKPVPAADGDRNIQLPMVRYGCKDPKKYGHTDAWASSSTSKPAAADMSAEEREKAKRERALVIENNKAWESAQVVRREWLVEFARRKAAPKGAAAFLAVALDIDHHLLGDQGARALAREWLAAKAGGAYNAPGASAGVEKATENRSLQVALVQVLAAYEIRTSMQNAWRGNGKTSEAGRYLRFLESCGYGLSDVEKFAISGKTA